jgi:hypothetical protein
MAGSRRCLYVGCGCRSGWTGPGLSGFNVGASANRQEIAMIFRSPLLAATLLATLAGCARPAGPRVEGPLAIDVPELCTRCVETLECEGVGRRTTYVLDEKTTWGQIATIWDYLVQHVSPKTEDLRAATAYDFPGGDGAAKPAAAPGGRARLDVWQRRIELPGAVIVQKTGQWLDAGGTPIGSCRVLAPADSRRRARDLATAAKG